MKWYKMITVLMVLITVLGCQSSTISSIDDAYEAVKSRKENVKQVLKFEKYEDFDVILYDSQECKNNVMVFEKGKYYGGSSSSQDIGTYNTSHNHSSLIIIYGQRKENFAQYSYELKEMTIEKNIKDDYILDVYIVNEEEDIGYGKVYNDKNEMIYDF